MTLRGHITNNGITNIYHKKKKKELFLFPLRFPLHEFAYT